MKSKFIKLCLEERIRLAHEWKTSGLNQVEFAKVKGMEIGNLRYQLRYVRERFPERINDFVPAETQFASVPSDIISSSDFMEPVPFSIEHPVLTIQSNSINLCASNQINPSLLKTAIEVVLSC